MAVWMNATRKEKTMTSKAPPVPEGNRSPKGTGDSDVARTGNTAKANPGIDPDKKGPQGNTNVNTHHQGYQQDR